MKFGEPEKKKYLWVFSEKVRYILKEKYFVHFLAKSRGYINKGKSKSQGMSRKGAVSEKQTGNTSSINLSISLQSLQAGLLFNERAALLFTQF